MIRPATPSDTDAILTLAQATGLFEADELGGIREMIASHFAGSLGPDHHWIVIDEDGPAAVAYYAPEPFTSGVWNLYMLAVDPTRQGGGRGSRLVRHVEGVLGATDARILLIETSGVASFEPTRTFYRTLGYTEEARIRDYYAPGDDKVVFWKALSAPTG